MWNNSYPFLWGIFLNKTITKLDFQCCSFFSILFITALVFLQTEWQYESFAVIKKKCIQSCRPKSCRKIMQNGTSSERFFFLVVTMHPTKKSLLKMPKGWVQVIIVTISLFKDTSLEQSRPCRLDALLIHKKGIPSSWSMKKINFRVLWS